MMRIIKRTAIAGLLASILLSGFVVTTAGAKEALPEFSPYGKCREMKGYAGFPEKFWRWTEGPTPCKGQSANWTGSFAESAVIMSKEGTPEAIFTTKGGYRVKCTGDTGRGEIANTPPEGKTVRTFEWGFTNCVESFGGKCATTGAPAGVIETHLLWGGIGYIPGTTTVV